MAIYKIYKIISLSAIILLCLVGLIVGLVGIFHYSYGFVYSYSETYGGDAYTGIQNAAADTANNVSALGDSIDALINIGGWVVCICFLIKIWTTFGKLIEAIIDCKNYYAEKKKEKMEQMAASQNFANPNPTYIPPTNMP